MTKPKGAKALFKTTNWARYNAALKARESLTIWLDNNIQWYASANSRHGRQQIFTAVAVQFCLSIKYLIGLSLRKKLGFVQSLLRLAGLDWKASYFNAVFWRQKSLRTQLPYRPNTTGLNLLVDSTGLNFLGKGKYKRKKYEVEYRRQRNKVHLCIDATTLDTRSVEITDNSVGDTPMLPELLGRIPTDEVKASISANDAYDTKACHTMIVQCCAQALTPPRENANSWKATMVGALTRSEALKACHRLERRIWKKWSGYHCQSLVETRVHFFKRLGVRVIARTFDRQFVKLNMQVAHNHFSRLGRSSTVPIVPMS